MEQGPSAIQEQGRSAIKEQGRSAIKEQGRSAIKEQGQSATTGQERELRATTGPRGRTGVGCQVFVRRKGQSRSLRSGVGPEYCVSLMRTPAAPLTTESFLEKEGGLPPLRRNSPFAEASGSGGSRLRHQNGVPPKIGTLFMF